jgi:hypothetical protein
MSRHLETEAVMQALAQIRQIQGMAHPAKSIEAQSTHQDGALEQLLSLLSGDWILSVQGYFLNHRPNSPYAQLDDEYKIQDLVYCLVSSIIPDLHYENPQEKTRGALASTRVDFSSESTGIFLEVKLATSKHQAKKVESEISEDIVKYGKHRPFDTLVFLVFCHNYAFPNAREFEAGFTGDQQIGGHRFQTFCVVKP